MVPAFTRVIVPPSNPVKAAVSTRELFETFMKQLSSISVLVDYLVARSGAE
jgi:hypothetical protein